MKTYWKEKYIGKVLGGFLEDKNISIYMHIKKNSYHNYFSFLLLFFNIPWLSRTLFSIS